MSEKGWSYKVRTAVTPEDVQTSAVKGVVSIGVDGGVLTLRSKEGYVEHFDDAVLAVYSNGSWIDAVRQPE